MNFIKSYVLEQVSIGRMSGPFTKSALENLLGSHFISSPLSVVEKAGNPENLRLIQNCSFVNSDGMSVNDYIDSDLFPTAWGTAAEFAQLVSPFISGCNHHGFQVLSESAGHF